MESFGWLSSVFSHEIPQNFSRLPRLGAIFFKCAPPTWNPGSAPDIEDLVYYHQGVDILKYQNWSRIFCLIQSGRKLTNDVTFEVNVKKCLIVSKNLDIVNAKSMWNHYRQLLHVYYMSELQYILDINCISVLTTFILN